MPKVQRANPQVESLSRPVVYDYGSWSDFFKAMYEYQKQTSHNFSIRQRTKNLKICSPALVTQVLNGERRLTRDQMPSFAKLFKLNQMEFEYLDKNMRATSEIKFKEDLKATPQQQSTLVKEPKNHLLQNWLNVYVKDLIELKGFSLNPQVLHKMLFGIATPEQIESSVQFLIKEGFWKFNGFKKIVLDETLTVSTNNIPIEKIRSFHKKALQLALRGLDMFPISKRKAFTFLISVNKKSNQELQTLLESFRKQLNEFIENHPGGDEELMQININMTPIGGHSVHDK